MFKPHVINQKKASHGRERSLNKSLSAFCGCRPHAPIFEIFRVTDEHEPPDSKTIAWAASCKSTQLRQPRPREPKR